MEYEAALSKAWRELKKKAQENIYTIRLLGDSYTVNLLKNSILSNSCNISAKPYTSILILHFMARKLCGIPQPSNKWISFKELEGGQGYYPAFKKRVLDVIKRKYGASPDTLFELKERFDVKKEKIADASIALETFEGTPVLITLWKGDREFGPEANLLFDKNITDKFSTEDIVVLSEIVAHSI